MDCNPWEEYPDVWPTKAMFFSWLRGALRRYAWAKHPIKFKFKNEVCGPPPKGYKGKARSGAPCALTGVWTGKSQLEVDHKEGHIPLNDWKDIEGFVLHLVRFRKEDLQLVSKEAHKVKSYADRMQISFEQALLEKRVITFTKQSPETQKEVLRGLGAEPDALGSAPKRKSLYRLLIGVESQGGVPDVNKKAKKDPQNL